MFAKSVHCQLSVANGSRKVVQLDLKRLGIASNVHAANGSSLTERLKNSGLLRCTTFHWCIQCKQPLPGRPPIASHTICKQRAIFCSHFRTYGSNSTWLDSTRHVRLCRASRDERVERDEPCSSNMADDERSCTSVVVFMLLHTQILFVSSNKIN